jgi:RND family efflux transporter MFP subunit
MSVPARTRIWCIASVLAVATMVGFVTRPASATTAAPGTSLAVNQCLIEPLQRIEVRASVAAPITVVHVDRGSVVRKGQLLVSLDAAVEQAALEVARFRSAMEGPLESAASRRDSAAERLKRREELLDEKFISAQDRDDAAAELRVAQAELRQANESRELARLEALQLAASVARFSVLSPVNGVVIDRLQHPGEMPQLGENAPAMLTLAQIDPLRVEIVLPVAQHGRIRPGSQVVVQPEAPFSGRYRATVKGVDRVMDSASGTFRARLELPNPRGDMPVGVRCTALI